jgi:hypothetical protein
MQPYTYEWKRCENDESIGTAYLAEDLCPGTYYVTVKDANQCAASSACDTSGYCLIG